MRAVAAGVVHHFFPGGEVVQLRFESADVAAVALRRLGDGWTRSDDAPEVAIYRAQHGDLDAVKARFASEGFDLEVTPCRFRHCVGRCADAEIDGVPHSVDHGPPFRLAVEVDDPRQLCLFGDER